MSGFSCHECRHLIGVYPRGHCGAKGPGYEAPPKRRNYFFAGAAFAGFGK